MASTEYYTPTGVPATGSDGDSDLVRNEFSAIKDGISEKLPDLTGNNNYPTFVNSGATGLESKTPSEARTLLDVYSKGDVDATITTVTDSVAVVAADVAQNTSDITQNTADITQNTSDVAAVEAIVGTGVLGVGQTWQDMTGDQRRPGGTYTNDTGSPIFISIRISTSLAVYTSSLTVDSLVVSMITVRHVDTDPIRNTHTTIVPHGSTYLLTDATGTTIAGWLELR